MSHSHGDDAKRLQEVLAALVARRIEDSLGRVEAALSAWRRGEGDALEAHAETLRHATRASALSSRVAQAGLQGPLTLLRDAFDLGIVDAAEFERLAGRPVDEVSPPPSLEDEAASGIQNGMPQKREVLAKLLEDGPVLLHLDARRDGVDVPANLKGDPKLVLRVGHGLKPPIPDLEFDDETVRATLSFRGAYHACRVPWKAVYALVAEDGRGLVWPEDVPAEVARDFRGANPPSESRTEPEPPQPRPKARPGHLKLVT